MQRKVIGKAQVDLPTAIDFEEAKELAVRVSALEAGVERAKEGLDATTKELKADVKRLEKEHREQSRWLAQMKLPKLVEVEYELVGSTVRTIRLDTGEVAAERPATKDDLQVPAFGEPPKVVRMPPKGGAS